MSFTTYFLPFKQLIQGQKYFPSSSSWALSKANSKNYSTSFSYTGLKRLAFNKHQFIFPFLWYSQSYSMHEDLTFFIKGVTVSHSGRHFFILDSCVYIFLDLTKFWQHFALISKYTTWKRWHQFHHNQVCTRRIDIEL